MKDQRLQVAMLVGEIQTLAFMVNQFTKYCVFVRYSGHVENIEIDVAASKNDYANTIVRGGSRTKSYDGTFDFSISKLNKLKFRLKKILRENNVDYSQLHYEVEEVRHYKLV